jgi:Family of unknown function (DUF5946)
MSEYDDQDTIACTECGAPLVDGMTCREQLGMIAVLEFQDPELFGEHFLTVAAYNLQHPAQFTDEAIAGLRAAFIERLDNGLTIAEIRHRAATAYAGEKRVLKDQAERRPVLRRWCMTIADVYIPDQPEGTAERVRRWAAAIRGEL